MDNRFRAKLGKKMTIHLLILCAGSVVVAGIGILMGVEFKEDVRPVAVVFYLTSWMVWGAVTVKVWEKIYGP